MANVKISNLTAATTPLAGTEVLPVVQSGATVKASIANVQTATYSGGTANGVAYLNGSKVLTTGSALVFDGTNLGVGTSSPANKLDVQAATGTFKLTSTTGTNIVYSQISNTGGDLYMGRDSSAGSAFYVGSPAYGAIFLSTGAYPMTWAINGSERMRLDSSGNLLVGTTSSSGTISNTAALRAGIFSTNTGSTSAANNTATTLATLSSALGTYIISLGFNGIGDAVGYSAVSIVNVDQTAKKTDLVTSTGMVISMSGLAVQGTQKSGSTLNIGWSILRIQ